MGRPSAGDLASYGTVVAITTAEGTLQFMAPPYLEQASYSIASTGLLYGLPFGVALLCRQPARMVYRGPRMRLLVAGAALGSALVAILQPLAPSPNRARLRRRNNHRPRRGRTPPASSPAEPSLT